MRQTSNLKGVSDDELLRRLSELIRESRRAEANIVAHIGEVDARKLYARCAASSMFVWCTEVLGLSEPEAYLRITVARASRRHPMLLDMLRDGRLHLRGIALLARYLTVENREDILARAAGLSHRKLQELSAELEPKPDVRAGIRRLPTRGTTASVVVDPRGLCTCRVDSSTAKPLVAGAALAGRLPGAAQLVELGPGAAVATPPRRAIVEPLAPARHKVQFTASDELRGKLERLQSLMRTTIPDGDLAAIIDQAVTEKLERLEARRFGKKSARKSPGENPERADATPASRHIPAAVRRAVHERDGGRCTYEDARGRRCKARERLEFHHHGKPFGRGGDHGLGNIRLMCRTHNQLLAEVDYGEEKMARYRRRRPSDGHVHEPMAVYGGGRGARPGRASPPS